ncbi:aminotransferase class V-fold PLP-dependent enzyme [Pandoraea pneumonica]|uniref:aminotransferase class V-fold PLP-dependent enzyme n=1 Tax=Pandoraea pneumonica TaxID=2508299 RepID=UPI003CFB4632
MDLNHITAESALAPGLVYFDHAAASVPPRCVVDTMTAYLNETARTGPYLPAFRRETYARVEQVRAATAAFVGANPSEIAFTKNGSEAISLVAAGIDWQDGDEVVLSDFEMISNQAPWLQLQAQGRVKVVVVPANADGVMEVDTLAKSLTPRTRLISMAHLPNVTGALQPIDAICALARERNVWTLINATQTVGMVPIDVRALGCDFLATCGRKALRGPEGSGFLYVREALVTQLRPALIGWWNASVDANGALSLPPTAKRLEAGCPIVPSILGMGEAIAFAQSLGMADIYARVQQLTRYAVEQLQTLPGAEIYGPSKVEQRLSLVPFNVKGLEADAIVAHLEAAGVIIEAGHFMATPILKRFNIERMARLAVHYFNSEQEIDRAVALIRELLDKRS